MGGYRIGILVNIIYDSLNSLFINSLHYLVFIIFILLIFYKKQMPLIKYTNIIIKIKHVIKVKCMKNSIESLLYHSFNNKNLFSFSFLPATNRMTF